MNAKTYPTFSVIIPAYQAEASITAAIQSVLDQHYAALDIIVVDDGSSDNTAQKVKEFGRAVTLIQQQNQGPAAARNNGVKQARGNWLCFLDSDDLYLPNRLKAYADFIVTFPHARLITGNDKRVYGHDRPESSSMRSTALGKYLLERNEPYALIDQENDITRFLTDDFASTNAMTFTRELFDTAGGYPQDHKIGEDDILLIKAIALAGHIGAVCAETSIHYVRSGSITQENLAASNKQKLDALLSLKPYEKLPSLVRKGTYKRTQDTRYSLALSYLRTGDKSAALKTVFAGIAVPPRWSEIRNFLSILRG